MHGYRLTACFFLFLWDVGEVVVVMQMTEKEFIAISRPLNLGPTVICMLMIYLCLIGKTRQIDDMIEYMEEIVNIRRHRTNFGKFEKSIFYADF